MWRAPHHGFTSSFDHGIDAAMTAASTSPAQLHERPVTTAEA
jgi:hypothetical protein